MKMTSMAMKPEKEGKSEGCSCCQPCVCEEGKPRYPWGLQICLENDQLEALGIAQMPKVGETVTITAVAKLTRCSEEEREGEESIRSMSLQITDMSIEMAVVPKKMDMGAAAKALYSEE